MAAESIYISKYIGGNERNVETAQVAHMMTLLLMYGITTWDTSPLIQS